MSGYVQDKIEKCAVVIGDNETWTGLKTFYIPIFEYAAKKNWMCNWLGFKTNQILISNFVENQTVGHNNF